MLITFIITVAILAGLYILVNVCSKKIQRPSYDFSTGATKSLVIFGHVGFCVSFLFIASDIIGYFTWQDQTALWCIYGIFVTFAILFIALLYETYFTYAAIRGDEVYVRGFFKTKIINVNDIRRIDNGAKVIEFYGKQNKCLFRASLMVKGVGALIGFINERKSDGVSEAQKESRAQEKEVLTELGREYRASYPERRKKSVRNFLVFGILFVAAIVLLLHFIGTDTAVIVGLGILSVITLAVCLFSCLYNIKNELNKDDEWLGEKYKFTNKKVKGASKNTFMMICVVSVCCMILGASMMLALLGLLGDGPNYYDYTPVTGNIEYCREQTGKYNYIAIGFYDMPTEYRLSSVYLDEFDYSFFKEVKVGDKVTVYVDNGEPTEFSIKGVSKKQWNNFYYLSTRRKEYFTYEDYVKSREHNDTVACVIGGIGITIIVASAVTIVVAHFVCKNRAADEDIVIYK